MYELRIAKPCNASWTSMKGDDKVRFCGACQKNVYNISSMPPEEVDELIRKTEGNFCARLYQRSDQRVLTSDCPKGVATVRRRIALSTLVAGGALVFGMRLIPIMGGVSAKRIKTSLSPKETTGSVAPPVHEPFSEETSGMIMGDAVVEPVPTDLGVVSTLSGGSESDLAMCRLKIDWSPDGFPSKDRPAKSFTPDNLP